MAGFPEKSLNRRQSEMRRETTSEDIESLTTEQTAVPVVKTSMFIKCPASVTNSVPKDRLRKLEACLRLPAWKASPPQLSW